MSRRESSNNQSNKSRGASRGSLSLPSTPLSSPNAAALAAAQAAQAAMTMWPVPPMWNPFTMAGPASAALGAPAAAAASTSGRGNASKPWDLETDSDSDEFVPPKKSRQQKRTAAGPTEKRGPGRPSRAEIAQRSRAALLANYPRAFEGADRIAFAERDECVKCRINVGKVAIKPCGHGKFCRTCINRIREEALKLERPSKCLRRDCYSLVSGWVELFNVSG